MKLMCNHTYTSNPETNTSIPESCPFPELFKKPLPASQTAPHAGPALALPIDSDGACIFHSHAAQWKRDNGFMDWLLQAIERLEADTSAGSIDFTEAVFVAGDPTGDGGKGPPPLTLQDAQFDKVVKFIGATFLDAIRLNNLTFGGGVYFDEAVFNGTLTIDKSTFMGFRFSKVTLRQGLLISEATFRGYALFDEAQLLGTTKNFMVFACRDSMFDGITSFSSTVFSGGNNAHCLFEKTTFDGYLDFELTEFRSTLHFSDVCFKNDVDFRDTLFAPGQSSAKYQGASFELSSISLPANGAISFVSTDPLQKMFSRDVSIKFKESPEGTLHFENVNFHHILEKYRNQLKDLERTGHVSIGPGCIKYRLQTAVRSVPIDGANAPLVAEICQTFTTYFSARNGINLGFEIVSRTKEEIRFFYFTDEDISEEVFLDRLEKTEHNLWDLISTRPDLKQLAEENAPGPQQRSPVRSVASSAEDDALINAVDAISAMFGTFFRVSVRILRKTWKPRDTQRLLQAIHFGDGKSLEGRADSLHHAIVRNYTPDSLDEINARHHAGLLPMPTTPQTILFLGADPSNSAELALHREFQEIDRRLRSANLREAFRLEQLWEVQAEQLPGVIMRFNPQILHFCGHGQSDGALVFLDAHGIANPVDKNIISTLFALLGSDIRCVVLNACYSAIQAKMISAHVDVVIGMSHEIETNDAITFAAAFYEALAYGKKVRDAFNIAKLGLDLAHVPKSAIPQIFFGPGVDPSQLKIGLEP